MPADVVQADYEVLTTVANDFDGLAELTAQTTKQIQLSCEQLYGANWKGEAANAFWQELNHDVLPKLSRLTGALQSTGDAVRQMISTIKEAEERAAAPFKNDTGSGGPTVSPDNGAPPQQPVVTPDSTNMANWPPSGRTGDELNARLDSYNVATNSKYLPRDGKTWCNLYASDAVQSMGAPLPLYVPDANGHPQTWLGATYMKDWLDGKLSVAGVYQQGTEMGWVKVDASQAAQAANRGYIAVAAGHGHIAVVRAGNPADVTKQTILISQAGASNFNSGPLINGWGQYINEAEFYVYTGI